MKSLKRSLMCVCSAERASGCYQHLKSNMHVASSLFASSFSCEHFGKGWTSEGDMRRDMRMHPRESLTHVSNGVKGVSRAGSTHTQKTVWRMSVSNEGRNSNKRETPKPIPTS